MRLLILVFFLFNYILLYAQVDEQKAIQKTIENFFEGFHKQDSLLIKDTVFKDIVLQTIGKDSLGNAIVKHEKFNAFLRSIVSIPNTTKFEEKLLSFDIKVDGPMANAWTTYEFWVNDTFSHCGVNSFQLFKEGSNWKIIYLIDTRRKEGCPGN